MITQAKANRLLKDNVDGLLRARGQSRKDLAQWCHKSESWISKIFKEERREFQVSQLDRIADFFGLDTYRLFQPGIVRGTERRKADRRTGKERRVGYEGRLASHLQSELNKVPRLARRTDYDVSNAHPELRVIIKEYEREIAALEEKLAQRNRAPTVRTSSNRQETQPPTPSTKRH